MDLQVLCILITTVAINIKHISYKLQLRVFESSGRKMTMLEISQ